MRTLIFAMATASLAWSSPSEAQIQNPYAVAILVNDRVITNFEVTQRASLLQALGTRGNLEKVAHEQLIEDRLRLQAAAQAKLTLNDDEIASGVSEFAARSDLTRDQLYQYIEKNGATKESMQAFVHAGLLWRNLVQARFSSLATISNEEIDKTLDLTIGRKKQSVLFSEIRLPLNQGNNKKVLELAEELSNSIKTEGEFAAAARQHSQSPSRAKSGRLDWLPAAELPPSLVGQILVLQPGEVTAPIISGQSVGLFQLRGVRSDRSKEQETVTLDYVSVDIPGEPGSKQLLDNATKLINNVDTCNDLRTKSQLTGVLSHTNNLSKLEDVPHAVSIELTKLDRHEALYYTNSLGTLTVVMLCGRSREISNITREQIRTNLFNQRIGGFGQRLLEELKANAIIEYK